MSVPAQRAEDALRDRVGHELCGLLTLRYASASAALRVLDELRACKAMDGLSDATLGSLAEVVDVVQYAQGEEIFREGEVRKMRVAPSEREKRAAAALPLPPRFGDFLAPTPLPPVDAGR